MPAALWDGLRAARIPSIMEILQLEAPWDLSAKRVGSGLPTMDVSAVRKLGKNPPCDIVEN
ncbi:MAG TPA: hypothetical protein PLM33_12505 [Acidobacteriota bacterium]|nr:hypothetical protein [Acidobacteriota bacterium]HRV08252.1 hypothetical protein [Acidobacteriota bacterium]